MIPKETSATPANEERPVGVISEIGESESPETAVDAEPRLSSEPKYIVGIGASAGGLEAIESLFDHLPSNTGMAFVLVQHLSPDFKSLMSELLARHTPMRILRVEHDMPVEADTVYLIPPKKNMVIASGRLLLSSHEPNQGLNLPIDIFFRSLALDAGDRSIGVILSGTGSDGSRGIREIHEVGGLVLVEDPEVAKFDGMPRSAISTGLVDFVLPPHEMGPALLRYIKHPGANGGDDSSAESRWMTDEDGFHEILGLLRKHHGLDFSHYKTNTLGRRLERRMTVRRFDDLSAYIEHLHADPAELGALYKDLLILVTRFFRDPEAFETLARDAIPSLIDRLVPGESVRVWIPGCATGEEAYSLAILFQEAFGVRGLKPDVKIFATDINRDALERASQGAYPESVEADLSPERLTRYFIRKGSQYVVSPELRQMVIFAPHNLVKDPPFTRIDLVSCRNLLIYLRPMTQRRILSLFHFALRAGGTLFLGPSETAGELGEEFNSINHHWKIYSKRRDVRLPGAMLSTTGIALPPPTVSGRPGVPRTGDLSAARAYDLLLDKFVPPSLLVNERFELMHVFGDAGKFLERRAGRASLDVLSLVGGELRIALSTALHRAAGENRQVVYNGVHVRDDGVDRSARLSVEPLQRPGEPVMYLISFQSREEPRLVSGEADYDAGELSRERLHDVERELQYTREHLQATVEELQTSNEELQSSNEELLASNEELQSTNEELHSVNEELYTVNAEYQRKIDELSQLNSDIDNLLHSTDIGTVFLDEMLRIRKFTPAAARIFQLLSQDLERPIEHLSYNLDDDGVVHDARAVLDSGTPVTREVRDRKGNWFLMRIMPYRDDSSRRRGVVLTFVDIAESKRAERELRESDRKFHLLADHVRDVFWITSADGRSVEFVSPAYEELWERPASSLSAVSDDWVAPIAEEDRALVLDRLSRGEVGEPFEIEYRLRLPDGRIRWISDRRFPVVDESGRVSRMVGLSRDVTAAKLSRELTETLAAVAESVSDAVISLDVEGHLLTWNDGAARLYGYSRDEVVGRPAALLVEEHQREELSRIVAAAAQGERTRFREFRALRNGGESVPVAVSISPVRDENGRIVFLARVDQNLTDRELLARADKNLRETLAEALQARQELAETARRLAEANATLRRQNQDLDEFAFAASHDLQEPLRSIVFFTEALTEDIGGDLSPQARDDLRFLNRAARKMQQLVGDLLDLSRASRGELRRDPVKLVKCVAGALSLLRQRVQETGARVRFQSLPEALGDERALTQLFINLLGNSLKFHGDAPPRIEITAEPDAERREWIVTVADQGIGFGSECAEAIFSPFHRLLSNESLDGTGIGLTICRKVVERHGGRIWAESEPGRGARFMFTLPMPERADADDQ